jgi:O-acetyl-ADP-ribose deacetylase (regulator of RNase III)
MRQDKTSTTIDILDERTATMTKNSKTPSKKAAFIPATRPNVIDYKVGNLMNPDVDGPVMICHSVNNTPFYGAGVIMAVDSTYPKATAAYVAWANGKGGLHGATETGAFDLGEIQIVKVAADVYVCNLCGQDNVGSTDTKVPVVYGAVMAGLIKLHAAATELGATVVLPRIGAGIGGGDWAQIAFIIEAVFKGGTVAVQVYDLPTPPKPAPGATPKAGTKAGTPNASIKYSSFGAFSDKSQSAQSGFDWLNDAPPVNLDEVAVTYIKCLGSDGPGNYEMLWSATGSVVTLTEGSKAQLNAAQTQAVKTALGSFELVKAGEALNVAFETVEMTDATDLQFATWKKNQPK